MRCNVYNMHDLHGCTSWVLLAPEKVQNILVIMKLRCKLPMDIMDIMKKEKL